MCQRMVGRECVVALALWVRWLCRAMAAVRRVVLPPTANVRVVCIADLLAKNLVHRTYLVQAPAPSGSLISRPAMHL